MAVAVAAVQTLLRLLAEQVVVEILEHHLLALALLALRILAVVVAVAQVAGLTVEVEPTAALALLSCPTPCQKAQLSNSCLLLHGKHQQASLLLITWW
jgi:hypothetical protein